MGIGIDPGQMLFEKAVDEFGPYLQFASLLILVVFLYFSFNWIIEGIKRSRRAFRIAGVVGVAAILIAFVAGLVVFSWEQAIFALMASMVLWLYATW